MARLSLSFLGPLQVSLDGWPVTGFESSKVRALLAYLAMEADRPHPREALIGLLWPDFVQSSAFTNLRRALSNLRACLGDQQATPPFLLITREAIRWNPEGDYEMDVATFKGGMGAAETGAQADEPGALARLASCLPLYRGQFLEGLAVRDSPAFDAWLRAQREHWEQQYLALLERLGALYERAEDYAQAQRCAQRQVDVDPLREEGQRRLMRALALGGDRNGALTRYQAFRATLAEELGVEPAPETQALAERIRSDALVAPPHVGPLVSASPSPPIPESPSPTFVAREQELAHLGRWLEEALRGQGRVGFVVGDPGSGKTALLRAFARRAMEAHPQLIVAEGGCNAYAGMGDPYLPFAEALRLLSGDVQTQQSAGALSQEHAGRLLQVAPEMLQAVLDKGPTLIGVLLPGAMLLERARALPGGAPWVSRVQAALAERAAAPSQAFLFDQATRVLQELTQRRPLVLILDDLQWADAASIALLFHLGRRLAGQRILILGGYRPEEVAAGREGQPHPLQAVLRELQRAWGQIQVDLDRAQGEAFVEALLDSEPNRLGEAFRRSLYEHTSGHALFTVELLRGLQERRDLSRDPAGFWIEGPSLDWDTLPARVEAAIAERIERLPRREQELLSVASVEGEEFHAEVAARVLGLDQAQVLASLSESLSQQHRLVAARSLRRVGEQAFSCYRFQHYLFQHYLYHHLDPVRRAHWHGQVASALEALGAAPTGAPDPLDTRALLADDCADLYRGPEPLVSEATLAWHWEQAGVAEKAILWYFGAVRRAWELTLAHDAMLAHTRKQLALLATLPESPRRALYEHWVYQALGVLLIGLGGFFAPGAEEAWSKSLERAEQSDDRLAVADGLAVLAVFRRMCGNLELAHSLSQRAVAAAQGGPPPWLMNIQGELALTSLYRGDLEACIRQLAPLSEALLGAERLPPWVNNDHLNRLEHLAWALWCQGYPDRAQRVSQELLEVASRDQRGFQLGSARQVMLLCGATCFIHQLRRDVEGVERGLRMLLPILEARECSPNWWPVGTFYQGWVHARTGALEPGISELRESLAEISQDNTAELPYLHGYLAEALGQAGRAVEGLAIVDRMLAQVERTGERWSEAELHRLKGELLLRRGDDVEEVETWYRQAIAVAQQQEARSWELRATTSLARLLRDQGRVAEAREMLAAIYNWFTEGFDTLDLLEAKALLDELQDARQR